MPVRIGAMFIHYFLQQSFQRVVNNFDLSISLRVIWWREILVETNFLYQLRFPLILKVSAIVSENISQDKKLSNSKIKHEVYNSLTIATKGRHGLKQLGEVIDGHNNVKP